MNKWIRALTDCSFVKTASPPLPSPPQFLQKPLNPYVKEIISFAWNRMCDLFPKRFHTVKVGHQFILSESTRLLWNNIDNGKQNIIYFCAFNKQTNKRSDKHTQLVRVIQARCYSFIGAINFEWFLEVVDDVLLLLLLRLLWNLFRKVNFWHQYLLLN